MSIRQITRSKDLQKVSQRLPMFCSIVIGGTVSNVLGMIAIALGFFGGLWLVVAIVGWLRTSPWKGRTRMQMTIDDFRMTIESALPELEGLSEIEAGERIGSSKWSKKEILGHLIDSASNNHQRFVRAQLSAEIKLPGYEQASWVNTQHYAEESWSSLVQLWESYNRHLLHIISAIPETALQNHCFIGEDEPVTLEFLVQDYVRHLKHHLDQLKEVQS